VLFEAVEHDAVIEGQRNTPETENGRGIDWKL
jgi:hypothetical protein